MTLSHIPFALALIGSVSIIASTIYAGRARIAEVLAAFQETL